jgi:hypothetical protein
MGASLFDVLPQADESCPALKVEFLRTSHPVYHCLPPAGPDDAVLERQQPDSLEMEMIQIRFPYMASCAFL